MVWFRLIQRKWATFCSLTRAERWAWWQAWVLLMLARVGVRVMPLPRLQSLLSPGVPELGTTDAQEVWPTVQNLQRLVSMAARYHPHRVGCLPRAVALQALLAQRGIVSNLRIGVCMEAGRLSAHAWLECGGQPVGESEPALQRFLPLQAPGER